VVARSGFGTRLLVAAGVVVFLVYLVLLDLGISAGRIHHGVSVQGVDVGGLTQAEATVRLRLRARDLKDDPVYLTGHGLDRSLLPTDVKWRPRPEETAAAALRVGRDGAPFGAMWDRLRAWFGGVELEWAGKPRAKEMSAYVKDVARDAAAQGDEVDRVGLRRALRLGISDWPREPVAIPLEHR
jgi:hypothetical protein